MSVLFCQKRQNNIEDTIQKTVLDSKAEKDGLQRDCTEEIIFQ